MYGDVLLRLAIDVVAIAVLAYGLYYRRHGRRDLVVIYSMFNIGLFLALIVISSGNVSIGVGFGLFAVLSIVRLRSEPFTNGELAYFFVALVLGLVNGIDLGSTGLAIMLSGARARRRGRDRPPAAAQADAPPQVTLETIPSDEDALRRHLEERLNARVTECHVLEIDYVRETTRVSVRCSTTPLTPPTAQLDASARSHRCLSRSSGSGSTRSARRAALDNRARRQVHRLARAARRARAPPPARRTACSRSTGCASSPTARTYFDTADLVTYREHVQGRRRRFKCRSREYVDSGLRAFEVKLKQGCGPHGQAPHRARRRPLDHLDGPQLEFLRAHLRDAYARELGAELAPTLSMSFTRITLVDPERCERLTCDLQLRFAAPDGSGGALAPDAAIVESKSRSGAATADRELRALGVRPIAGCSKYCIGVGLTYPRVKRNLSLPLLRRYFHTEDAAHARVMATG